MTLIVLAVPVVLGVLLVIALLARPWATYRDARRLAGNQSAVAVSNNDAELSKAETDARAQLPGFLSRLRAPQATDSEFMVKFRLRSGPTPEQIWAEQLRCDGDRLMGRLANDPLTRGYRFDQEVEIPEAEIMDWGFRDNGVMQGHFSTRVFLERMPEHVQTETCRSFGWPI